MSGELSGSGRAPRLGRIRNPYPTDRCAASECRTLLAESTGGAYLHTDLDSGKLVLFCESCSQYVELHAAHRFPLVAL